MKHFLYSENTIIISSNAILNEPTGTNHHNPTARLKYILRDHRSNSDTLLFIVSITIVGYINIYNNNFITRNNDIINNSRNSLKLIIYNDSLILESNRKYSIDDRYYRLRPRYLENNEVM